MNQIRSVILGLALFSGLSFNCGISAKTHSPGAVNEQAFCKNQLNGAVLSKTELFFGLSRPNGSDVTQGEFQDFIDTEVIPRFPDGLTLLPGEGRFKDSAGTIIQEKSNVLILLYVFNQKRSKDVERIRQAYKQAFQQESVLRVDEQSCVSF